MFRLLGDVRRGTTQRRRCRRFVRTWRPVQFVCCSYFLRLGGHFRRKNNLGNNGTLALVHILGPRRALPHAWSTPPGKQQWRHRSRDDFSYLMRAPPARRRPLGNNATAPQSTRRLAQFLRRRCCRPRRRLTLAGKYQGRGRRHSYVAQLFRRHWFCVAPG